MKKCALVLWSTMALFTGAMGQTLTYQLLPDSSITPAAGGIPIGSSEPLRGSFTWVAYTPSDIVDSDTFNITSLQFTSSSYSFTLASGSQPDNTTQAGPDGQTGLNAMVNLAGSTQNPWLIGAYGSGSYQGPASAPTELVLDAEGLYPGESGLNAANFYIHARLVCEPAMISLLLAASPGAGGTVSGGGVFAAGSSHKIKASASRDYVFVNWTENGAVVSSTASYTFILHGNRRLVANFAKKTSGHGPL
jgi:hypothetical protein